ncbi:unannotated protein [freshwater metagenome]|uniref:Unannotated protein n=1 Tax=freshwater metagenome TaxID=449393 RepID=A0A6J6VD37_9ZZZZ
MNRLGVRSAALALLVSVLAGLAAGLLPGRAERPTDYDSAGLAAAEASAPGDRVRAAIEGVLEDGLHVAPELEGELGPSELAPVEQVVADSPVPLFVVWWEPSYDAGYSTDYAAMAQLRVGVGEQGYYAIVSRGSGVLVEANGLSSPFVDANGMGRPGDALLRLVEELSQVPPEPPYDGEGSDYWGGPGGGLLAGVLFVGLGYAALVPVVWLVGKVVR